MYALTSDPSLIFRDDGAWIPADPDNVDYQAFLEWRNAGNQPTPYTGPGQIITPPTSPATPPMEEPPPPDIVELDAQVQDIDARLTALETDLATR